MSMTERVKKLRQKSLEMKASISTQRAHWVTDFYRSYQEAVSVPVFRALCFQHLLLNEELYIEDGELIVGEKGNLPKAAPTFPELCCHSLSDLDMLSQREKIPFAVSKADRDFYENEVIPFWQGKSMRERIFSQMADEWKSLYEAGVFTEFMEQRAPGHTVLDGKIYKKGFLQFKQEIEDSLRGLDYLNDPLAYHRQEELKAMQICADALMQYAHRCSEMARSKAQTERDPQRRQELEQIARVCSRVPANPPRDFWEALQYYWFVHLGVTKELNTWDAFSPGRFDQHLFPFFQQGLEAGTLTREKAEELLQCLWIKFNNQPAPPKVGVTAAESGTYTDFVQINLGGIKEDGSDGVNELTYLLLDVVEEMRLLQPSASLQVSKKNPDRFVKRAARIIRTGFGQPSLFNADAVVQELVGQGKSLTDARQGGTSGCVETGAFGKESYILTGYFNLPKVLELTLHNGFDPCTGKQIGIKISNAVDFQSMDVLLDAFRRQLIYLLEIKLRGNQVIEQLYAQYMPAPFLSILVSDCIARGLDYNEGGARYNTTYIQGVGIGTITDSLSAIQYHVFDQKNLSMQELLELLVQNFEGHEQRHRLLLNKTPRYGNNDEYADRIMATIFEMFNGMISGRKNTKGGFYAVNMLPTTCHVYFGSVIGATPDGRLAGRPVSEGISPVQGADRNGPVGVILSAARMDHLRTGGTLLNQKFTPSLLKDDAGLNGLVQLVRTYFKLDGHHIQFNVVDLKTLREAQAHPELYRDLIVRVAGYSDYFCDLSSDLQEEIIARTEHTGFESF